ncbi:TIGR03013 family XrtA/PEP-CTERM system glycosyltransferase [Desulfosediminicola flagellatus]|uniref:TIGR03013 family XrtA/PEP-CTERM system glycosyltransferase n=1 Tax=Desulfosediminicola flagellatus TaxID=2569541 RepID=UPI00142F0191|nr:TIGR03013 family XrtA/PEP-CTERM system glycosyltransferase [Desulfosediminicola flagellatus]
MISVYWLFKGTGLFMIDLGLYTAQAMIVTLIFQLCLYFFDLYDLSKHQSLPDTATRITQAFGVGCILLAWVYYIAPPVIISTRIFWSGYLITSVILLLYRFMYYRVLRKKMFVQDIVVIGDGRLANEISMEIEGRQDSVYRIRAFIGSKELPYNPNKAPVLESIGDVSKIFPEEQISRIIVAPDDRRGATPVRTLLNCKMRGVIIEQGVTFYERMTGKILVERVDPSWIIFSDGFTLSRFKYMLKRVLDIFSAGFLLILSLPIMVLSAIIIKLESKGPVFYLQERVGENSAVFKVIKFRSMGQDAEKNGAVWAKENDDRVTRFGGFIRKVRIDEIPQLWNVLKGEMSLVGPRPERQVFVEELVKEIPYYHIRHGVKPGVTGWAQVCYPYGASKEDALRKLEYDLYYIKHISIALDLLVIFQTVKTVLFGKGGR